MENLIKSASWYNPYTALIGNENKEVEISGIKIFNEKGILFETNCGWFNSNNGLGNIDIAEIKMKRKINLNVKYNFVVKNRDKYILYIYYKNINYRNSNLYIAGSFLCLNATILDNYKITEVVGYTDLVITEYKEKNKINEIMKNIDRCYIPYHIDELMDNLDILKKHCKKIKQLKEEIKNYTIKDYKKMVYKEDLNDFIEKMKLNNINIEGSCN